LKKTEKALNLDKNEEKESKGAGMNILEEILRFVSDIVTFRWISSSDRRNLFRLVKYSILIFFFVYGILNVFTPGKYPIFQYLTKDTAYLKYEGIVGLASAIISGYLLFVKKV
jgi:hypothetical protein